MNKPYFIMVHGMTPEDEKYTSPIRETTATECGTYLVKFFESWEDAQSFSMDDLRCRHLGYEIHKMGDGVRVTDVTPE